MLLVVAGSKLRCGERAVGCCCGCGVGPDPVGEGRVIVALIARELEGLGAECLPLINLLGKLIGVDHAQHVGGQCPAVLVVQAQHVERRCRGAFLLVAVDAEGVVAGAVPDQAANRAGIGVEREEDGLLAAAEQLSPALIADGLVVLAGVLNLEQVDHVRHTITVRGKGNKERRVAVADAVWKRLAVWLEARAGDPCPNVFLAVRRYGRISTGHSITSSAVYQILKTRSSQSGVEDFSPHDLRRTFATRLLGAGTDINLVRKAMGHASVLTTQRYDKREDEEVEEATRKILI